MAGVPGKKGIGKVGYCTTTYVELASLNRITPGHAARLVRQLRDLRLVDWTRGGDGICCQVFEPDIEWIRGRASR
jgi:hypothetical protein